MRRLLWLVVASVFTQPVLAEYYERDGSYAYKVTKYKELFSSLDGVKYTAQMTTKVLVTVLEEMKQKRMLPESVVTRADIEKFRKNQEDMDGLVDYLNDFVKEQRARGGSLELVDVLPDAIMVFGGHKFSLAMGKGVGVSGSVGLVVMPVKIEKYSLSTGKLVDTYPSLRWSLVVWPSADAGLGIGGGARWRTGVAAIWDLNHSFIKPDQFWGAGAGASWGFIRGVGMNAKIGSLMNWESPQKHYFLYGAVAAEVGPAVELGSPRVNVTSIVKGETFMDLFSSSNEKAYKDMVRDMSRKLDDAIRANGPRIPGQGNSDNSDPADPGVPGTKDPVKRQN